MRETMDKVTDRVLGQLYDLTDGADWPSLPDTVDEVLDEMSDKTRAEMWDWKRDIVKAAVAEIVTRIAQEGESWVKILDAVLESETETIVATLEGDNDYNLGEHDSEMLAMYASDTGPDHPAYEVLERSDSPPDSLAAIRSNLATKLGVGERGLTVEYRHGGPVGCPLVAIILPVSDARELAR